MVAMHEGGCQCGKVRFKVEMDIGDVYACNCSRCGKLGSLLAFAPREAFQIVSGENELTTFEFNRRLIQHNFCKSCGIEPFALGINPKTKADMAAINVRCIDGIDVFALSIKHVDGKSF